VYKRKSNNICLTEFISKIPPWGGEYILSNSKILLTNTCSFDYFLFALWATSILSNELKEHKSFKNNQKMSDLIDSIGNKRWNEAKKIWLDDISKLRPRKDSKGALVLDCFGSL